MLFRKKMEPACAYCANGRPGENDDVICLKYGIRQPWQQCRGFRYDPLRRVPEAEPQVKADVDPSSFQL